MVGWSGVRVAAEGALLSQPISASLVMRFQSLSAFEKGVFWTRGAGEVGNGRGKKEQRPSYHSSVQYCGGRWSVRT